MKSDNYGVPAELLARYADAENFLEAAKDAISTVALANCGFAKGDIVEHNHTGHQYKIARCSVSVGLHKRVQIHVYGYRVWRTGRKAGMSAHSGTFLDVGHLHKVPQEEPADDA
jgi:hypothetical protein